MRIISGIYKNRELLSPNDRKTHPMGSREKLALFNMLSPYLADAEVLDCFAGSGALGLEALSRSAKKVTFIENSPKAAKIIKQNLESLNIPKENYELIVKDINKVDFSSEKFDIILADPPYDNFKIKEISLLVNSLKSGGILALSSPKNISEPPEVLLDSKVITLISSHTYAAARISLFKKV